MNKEFIINIVFENHDERRPAIFNSYFGDFLIDTQRIARIYYLCNALASNNEKIISLICTASDKKEDLKDWVELEAIKKEEKCIYYQVHNLEGYEGEKEWSFNHFSLQEPCIGKGFFEILLRITPPKYIYLKKTEIKNNIHIPTIYNHLI